MRRPFRWRINLALPDGVALLRGCPGHRFRSADHLVAWARAIDPTLRARGLEVLAYGAEASALFFPALEGRAG